MKLKKYLVIVCSFVIVLNTVITTRAEEEYKAPDFAEENDEHVWEMIQDEEDRDSQLLDENLEEEVHMFCSKCGYDLTEAYKKGILDPLTDDRFHDKINGCTCTGTVSYVKHVTIHTPATYQCSKCHKYHGAIIGSSTNLTEVYDKETDKIIEIEYYLASNQNKYNLQHGKPLRYFYPYSPTCSAKTTEEKTTEKPTEEKTTEAPKTIKVGDVVKSSKASYVIVSTSKKEIAYSKPRKKTAKVTIPDTVKVNGKTYKVTSVKKSAFKGNKTLKNVTIGKNISTIGSYAFSGCTNLTVVKVNSLKIKSLGTNAFANCKGIKKIEVKSKKLAKIGTGAFKGCKNLKTITLKSSNIRFGENCFKGINKKAKFIVPKSKVKAYKKSIVKKGKASDKVTVSSK